MANKMNLRDIEEILQENVKLQEQINDLNKKVIDLNYLVGKYKQGYEMYYQEYLKRKGESENA